MPKFVVTYYDTDGEETQCTLKADDEAAALGCVLDLHGGDIQPGSPFAIWQEGVCRRKRHGGRKGDKAKLLGPPEPVAQDLDLIELPETAAEMTKLFDRLGVELETRR